MRREQLAWDNYANSLHNTFSPERLVRCRLWRQSVIDLFGSPTSPTGANYFAHVNMRIASLPPWCLGRM